MNDVEKTLRILKDLSQFANTLQGHDIETIDDLANAAYAQGRIDYLTSPELKQCFLILSAMTYRLPE
jgi:hypothetical protein